VGHCLCLSSASPRSGCAQVQRHRSSSWEAFVFFGLPPSSCVANNNETFQQEASAQPCSSGWYRGHPLPPSLPPFLNYLVLADAGRSIHLNYNKAEPFNARNSTRSCVATSHRCFCISAKTFHLNFNKVMPINYRSRVATSRRCFCIFSTTYSLPSSALPRSGCVQVKRPCSSS
jgi:hypothetical protein